MQPSKESAMDGYPIRTPVGMPTGSMLRIHDGVGVLVYVWEGELWLTQEGSTKDHMLQAGQWLRIERGGAAIAHAFKRSLVSLSSPVPEVPAKSIELLQAGKQAPVILHRRAEAPLRRALRRFLQVVLPPRPSAA
jgi:hypothetical protein